MYTGSVSCRRRKAVVDDRTDFPGAGRQLGGGPNRRQGWARPESSSARGNFAVKGGPTASDLVGGCEVIGEGSQLAHKVILRFADGTKAEHVVADGLVRVYIDHPVVCPAQVSVLDSEGRALSDYSAIERFT